MLISVLFLYPTIAENNIKGIKILVQNIYAYVDKLL